MPAGLYLSTPLLSIDNSGGAPALGTLTAPTEWDGAEARIIRYAARLSTTGTPTWQPSGESSFSTSTDPDFLGSLIDIDDSHTVRGDVAGSGMTATGNPSAAAFLGLLAAHSDGAFLTPATMAIGGVELDTGHAYFPTWRAPAGSTWVHVAVTLGGTPPAIIDGNGFTWTTLVQQPVGTGYLTVWIAKITRTCGTVGERVTLTRTMDSSIGLCLAGQTP